MASNQGTGQLDAFYSTAWSYEETHGERGRLLFPMRNTHAGLGCHRTLNHGAIHRINHYPADKY